MDGTAVDVLVVGAEPVGPAARSCSGRGHSAKVVDARAEGADTSRAAVDLACSSGHRGIPPTAIKPTPDAELDRSGRPDCGQAGHCETGDVAGTATA